MSGGEWERQLTVEQDLLLAAADHHGIGPASAHALHRYASSRARQEPVRFDGRSMLTEAAEEIADLVNYLRWESVRVDSPEWQQVISRVIGDALLTWSSLQQAAGMAADLGIPGTGFPVETHGETRRHPPRAVD